MQWKLYLFGPPRLERNGRLIEVNLRKGLALVAFCAVTRRPHSRDALATLLWPDKDQQAARANLRRMLYELGQLLGDAFFVLTAEQVAIHPDNPLWLDIEEFHRCLAEESPATPARVARLAEAAGLYMADFLAGFTLADCPEFDDWQFFQREELRRSFASLLEQLVALYQEQERWEDCLQYARRLLALDPLEEEAYRRLMQLYAYAGQIGAALRQYEECVRILEQEFGAPPDDETTALFTAIRSKRFPAQQPKRGEQVAAWVAPPALISPAAPADPPQPRMGPGGNLPKYTTPFVGRRQELAEILQRLGDPDCRLLTIVGPGGLGKTRLASEAARLIAEQGRSTPAELPQFRDGVYFALLQPVSAPDRLIPVIADVLRLQFYEGESPQQQLVQFLQEKELLLVLDNFEHLLEGADTVAQILTGAPGVKLLVTSREALKLQEEWFHPIAGMRLPPVMGLGHAGGRIDVDSGQKAGDESGPLAASDAAQLFIQAARRARVTFDPHAEQAEIVRICRLVDGIPLALELAASWLKVLSCAEIAQEIEHGMDILVSRHQNVAARHRSMRVILDQSWQLLRDEAQQALRRIAVFRGGFLQDAAAIAGADLLTLAELVDVAWIFRAPDGRYHVHELLRQYAADKLAEDPAEAALAQDRHMSFYLDQVAECEPALVGPQQRAALDQIAGELDNIQAAWTRAAAGANSALIDNALHALYLFFHMRGRYAEGTTLFADALRHFTPLPTPPPTPLPENGARTEFAHLYPRLQVRLGAFYLHQGELDAAYDCFSVVVDGNANQNELAFAHVKLGELARQQGHRPAAEASLQQSLTLAQAIDDRNLMAEALLGLADLSSLSADFDASERLAREALALCRQLQRPELTARALAAVAWPVSCLGRYSEAQSLYRESLAIAETIANPFGVALATQFLGWVAYCEGGAQLAEAGTLFARALATWRRIGYRHFIAMGLADSALAAYEQGAYAQAKQFAQEGLAIAEDIKGHFLVSYSLNLLGAVACDLGELVASRHYLLRSLQITYPLHIPDMVAFTIYFLAKMFAQERELAIPSTDRSIEKQLQALEFLGCIIKQEATWQCVRDRAQRVQADLAARLPAEAAAAASERGRQQTIDEVAQTLLLEFQG